MMRPILFYLILISSITTQARQLYWLPTFGDWDDGSNWSLTPGGSSCNCTPGAGDTTHLNIVGSIVTIPNRGVAKANQVHIGFNATLRVGTSFGSTTVMTIADGDVGLLVTGTLQAYGQVNINRTPNKGMYILSGGTCEIQPGATIDIQPLSGMIDTLVHNRGMLSILGDKTNGKGQLLLEEVGIYGLLSTGSSATVDNKGVINIDSSLTAQSFGILNTFSSTFNNHADLSMMRCAGIGIQIDQNASFTNQSDGLIDFNNMYETCIRYLDGIFDNYGLINLTNNSGTRLIQTARSFTNSGSLIFENNASTAIEVGTTFENKGLIHVENASTAIRVLVDSLINTGEIYVMNVMAGISMHEASMFLHNEGTIQIEDAFSPIVVFSAFDNFGDCYINAMGNIGINLQAATMRNWGNVMFDQSHNSSVSILVTNNSELRNECGGVMKLSPRLSGNFANASIINDGYMELNLNLFPFAGTFENQGIISDLTDRLANSGIEPSGDGLILRPLQGQHTLSIPSHQIIEGPLNYFSFDPMVYYDLELSAPAGTFNAAENTWTPGIPAGLGIIYHSISNACKTFVVKQYLDDDVFSACPSFPNVNTKNATGTWYNHNHWSMDQIPTLCHDVVIPADMTNISGMQMGQARTIEVQSNAFFEVLGTLEIDGN